MPASCENECLFNKKGNVLISDQFNNRVIEVTPRGDIVWCYGLGPNNFTASSILGVNDAERVGELTLMAGTGILPDVIPEAPNGAVDNRVLLVSKCGKIVWQYGQFGVTGNGCNTLNRPVHSVFISCGKCKTIKKMCRGSSILITDQGNNRVIQVNKHHEIVWEYPTADTPIQYLLANPSSAEKLKNGNYLIADNTGTGRALEVDCKGCVVMVFTAETALQSCAFASRLCNGNTLLTDSIGSRVYEVNCKDEVVWQYRTNAEFNSVAAPLPSRAVRLECGDTLISDQYNNRVIRVDVRNVIEAYYGLALAGGSPIGVNSGYNIFTTQLGLYAPHDAKIIGDYTGLTPPF
jgi:hypothetical protein